MNPSIGAIRVDGNITSTELNYSLRVHTAFRNATPRKRLKNDFSSISALL